MDQKLFSNPYLRRSQIAYTLQAAFEYMAWILVSDSFLAKLLTNAGVDQASIGIISSVLSFASFSQLFIVFVQRKMKRVRVWVTVFKIFGMCLYTMVYFMPSMHLSPRMNTLLAYTFVIGGSMSTYLVSTLNRQWGFGFVDSDHRGRFVAVIEGFSLVVGTGCSLGAGYLVDHCEADGNLHLAFILLGIAIALFTVLDLIVILLMKSPPEDMIRADNSCGRLWKELTGNRAYLKILFMQILTNMATCTTVGFLGTYKTVNLGFSLWTLQIFSMIASAIRLCFAMPIGRFSDRHTYVNGYKLGRYISLASYTSVLFSTPGTRYLILAFMIFNSISDACTINNGDNMLYYYVPLQDYAGALAITHCITGVFGICASLVGSAIIRNVAAGGLQLFGIKVYAQQLQAAISLVLTIAVLLYSSLEVKKIPPEVNQLSCDN